METTAECQLSPEPSDQLRPSVWALHRPAVLVFCPQVFSTVLVRCKLLLEGKALTSSQSGGGGACGWLDGLPAFCCLTSPLCSRLSPVNLFTLKEGLGSLAVIAH